MATATETRCGIFEQPAEEYHADPAISKGKLSTFRGSHREYFHRFVACDAPAEDGSKKMDIGTLAHVALLEPDRLASAYAIFPANVLAKNGAESTNDAKAFRAEHEAAGRIVLKAHEFAIVQQMRDSVMQKIGSWLKFPNRIEQSAYWTDPATGIPCRCRPDWLIERNGEAFDFNFKTTGDSRPSAFSRVAEACDYPLGHAHYTSGIGHVLHCPVESYFVVVQTEFPFTCVLYELADHDKIEAVKLRNRLMHDLEACIASNEWHDYWERDVQPLTLRPWSYQ